MFAIPGIVALVIFIYARPQEFVERLRVVPFLYVFFALSICGGLLDLRVRNVKLTSTPQLPWIIAFFIWSAFTVLVRSPSNASGPILGLCICVALYVLIAHGVQSFRALHVVAGTVLAMVLLVCGVGAHQGFAPSGCVAIDPNASRDTAAGAPDGRPCDTVRACYQGDAEPGAEYACEHIGLFGTTSVGGGRVRYRGVLQDPNELALAGGAGLPLAFALGGVRREKKTQRLVTWAAFALVFLCAVMTGSRGGQLVFATVLGAYFLRRFGWRGLLIAGVLTLPLMLLGGRSGEEATSSTNERLDCWAEALSIWRSHPLLGVGLGQFGEYNYMTAHNSYLLALSELGIFGMVLFSIILWISAKVPFSVFRMVAGDAAIAEAGAPLARPWAMAMLAAFAGLGVGIFFLSFTYHYVLWIYIGLAGALYSAVRAHYPSFRVTFRAKDLAAVCAIDAAIVVFVFLYTRWALG